MIITMIILFIILLDITSAVSVQETIPDKLKIYQNRTRIDDGVIQAIYNRSLEGMILHSIGIHNLCYCNISFV